MTAAPRPKCGSCGHTAHRDTCRAKGPSGCVPLLDPDGRQVGIACGVRPPCPCPWGACHTCGAPIAGATPHPRTGESPEVDIDRGSAGAPDGTWAVWQLPNGTLACRPLSPGHPLPGPGEYRGRAHVHQLTPAKETTDA